MKSNSYMLSLLLVFLTIYTGCNDDGSSQTTKDKIQLVSAAMGSADLLSPETTEVSIESSIQLKFSKPVDLASLNTNITLVDSDDDSEIALQFNSLEDNLAINITFESVLKEGTPYFLSLNDQILGAEGEQFDGLDITFTTASTPLTVTSATIGQIALDRNTSTQNIPTTPTFELTFSSQVDVGDFQSKILLSAVDATLFPNITSLNDSTFLIEPKESLESYKRYTFRVLSIPSVNNKVFSGYSADFYTALDSTLKFPEISDDELLTKIQETTFKYFYDFGHPVSGLNRERNTSDDNVTIGGSGFGVMSIIVGIERGFITRQEGVDRLEKITNFLENKADRFHGVWSHWLSGSTGSVNPFSANDDGGDLVETAFMIQGLITARQYLNPDDGQEEAIIQSINRMIDAVEWDWYQQGGQDQLFWHWSPNFGWEKNLAIRGWNESLIIYVLAAASKDYSIDKEVYENGWAQNGAMVNSGATFYDLQLPLRNDMGGPLFFAHYSFLGLDPRNLSDQYANYWDQNRIHTLINRAYCVDNPRNYFGYSERAWGLTASDGNQGYSAHSPNNDRGVITPTAAISSIPYTPEESMEAIRFFYYILGDKLWGEYGFYDAFNAEEGWYARSYLAIDQGPIICMIENHRTGLLWDLFMSAPEVKTGLDKLDFNY